MEKILISACLAGDLVRYDAKITCLDHPFIQKWDNEGRLIRFCPEVAGGLPIPRAPGEIQGGQGLDVLNGAARVINIKGEDITQFFVDGAGKALKAAESWNIRFALLKEKSPSCGSTWIYDGGFNGRKIPGDGVTSALLKKNGIMVFSENQITDLARFVDSSVTS